MMDDERRERAEEISRKIAEGLPPESIFPRKVWTPPPPDLRGSGKADFVAATRESPHGGTPMRSYLLSCEHATTTLDLMGHTEEQDGEVLGVMLTTLRSRAAQGGRLCLCEPRGWGRA